MTIRSTVDKVSLNHIDNGNNKICVYEIYSIIRYTTLNGHTNEYSHIQLYKTEYTKTGKTKSKNKFHMTMTAGPSAFNIISCWQFGNNAKSNKIPKSLLIIATKYILDFIKLYSNTETRFTASHIAYLSDNLKKSQNKQLCL